eukprot:scaffold2481_cov83-Skeletonema_dohrnii-CCMP3373.AAC.7
MKITLPLSFLLCLPAMAMATDNAPDADAVLLRAVDTEAGQSKLSKFDEDGKTNRRRRAAKSAKAEEAPGRRRAAKSAKAEGGYGRRRAAKSAKAEGEPGRHLSGAKAAKAEGDD